MKVQNIILGLFLVICLCHESCCRSFYADSEEIPDPRLRHSNGQRNLEMEEHFPESTEILARGITALRQSLPDVASPWEGTEPLTAPLSKSWEDKPTKRSNLDEWNPLGPSQLPSQHPRKPKQQSSLRTINRGAFAKRQMILYRQCFFNPISCFHK